MAASGSNGGNKKNFFDGDFLQLMYTFLQKPNPVPNTSRTMSSTSSPTTPTRDALADMAHEATIKLAARARAADEKRISDALTILDEVRNNTPLPTLGDEGNSTPTDPKKKFGL